MSESHHEYCLTQREIEEILEPIRDHEHCWSLIAERLILAEQVRRAALAAKKNKRVGPYGDWPKDGH